MVKKVNNYYAICFFSVFLVNITTKLHSKVNIMTIKRNELKEKVPYGYSKVIAERANVTNKVVSDFLNGKNNSARVELATLEVLAELQQKKNKLLEVIMA